MAGYVLVGVLAAFGAFCALWALLGWFLPKPKGFALVYWGLPCREAWAIRRYQWMRDLGVVRCPLVLLDSSLSQDRRQQLREKCPGVLFYTREQWLLWIEQERDDVDRAGNADAPGNHPGGGVPEL